MLVYLVYILVILFHYALTWYYASEQLLLHISMCIYKVTILILTLWWKTKKEKKGKRQKKSHSKMKRKKRNLSDGREYQVLGTVLCMRQVFLHAVYHHELNRESECVGLQMIFSFHSALNANVTVSNRLVLCFSCDNKESCSVYQYNFLACWQPSARRLFQITQYLVHQTCKRILPKYLM